MFDIVRRIHGDDEGPLPGDEDYIGIDETRQLEREIDRINEEFPEDEGYDAADDRDPSAFNPFLGDEE